MYDTTYVYVLPVRVAAALIVTLFSYKNEQNSYRQHAVMHTNPIIQYFLTDLGSCGGLIIFFSIFLFYLFRCIWSRCSCLPVVLVYSCIGFVATLSVYCKPSKMVILLLLCCWYIVTHFNTKTTRMTPSAGPFEKGHTQREIVPQPEEVQLSSRSWDFFFLTIFTLWL